MTRILIIGTPGSGKSTLAQELGRQLGLKVIHLDRHFWTPGWVHVPFPDWIAKVEEIVKEESWIIDGNYARTFDIRLARADGVIWLDFSRWICLFRCILRIIQYYGRTRSDLAPGCPEKFRWEFITYIWTFRYRERPIVERTLQSQGGNIPVLHLKSPHDVNWHRINKFVTREKFAEEDTRRALSHAETLAPKHLPFL